MHPPISLVYPTFTEAALLITAIGSLIAAITGVIAVFRIERVHKTTNSKMDQLLKTTAEASQAKGIKMAEDAAAALRSPAE